MNWPTVAAVFIVSATFLAAVALLMLGLGLHVEVSW